MTRGLRRGVLLLAFSAVVLGGAGPASAVDERCGGGRGIQAWSNSWYGGSDVTWCAGEGGAIRRQNLTWDLWNDKISSVQIFNMPAGLKTCFFEHADYAGIRTLYPSAANPFFDPTLAPGIDNTWSSILTTWPEYNPCY